MKDNVLHIENLTMQFGGVVAVDNFSMDINKGEIVALIGPNGAGKTTAFNAVTGVYLPTAGRVMLNGENITGLRPDQITARGIARTFQNIRLFSSMTVFENVLTAHHLRRTSNLFSATFRLNRLEEKRMREDTEALLKKVDLYELKDEMAVSLPYGKQRLLEIVRALTFGDPMDCSLSSSVHGSFRARVLTQRLKVREWKNVSQANKMKRKLSTEELMLLNCGVGEDS